MSLPAPAPAPAHPRPTRAAVLVAHSSPVVALGLARLLHERRADAIQLVEAGQCAGSRACLVIADDAGLERHLRTAPSPAAPHAARLMIASGKRRPAERDGIDRWLSIECLEEELLEAVDQLVGDRRPAAAARSDGGLPPGLRRRLLAYIDEHLAEPIAPQVLARMAGLSGCHLARAFKQSFGAPPHRFLMRRRIERAAEAVRRSDRSLIDIALDFGFSDQSHFTRLFGRLVGETPSAHRARHRRSLG